MNQPGHNPPLTLHQPAPEPAQMAHQMHLPPPPHGQHAHTHPHAHQHPMHVHSGMMMYGHQPEAKRPNQQLEYAPLHLPTDLEMRMGDTEHDSMGHLGLAAPLDVTHMLDVPGESSMEAQLVELLSMVLNIQTSLLQFLAMGSVASSPSYQNNVAKKLDTFRTQLTIGSRKIVKLSKLLSMERKKHGFARRTQRSVTMRRDSHRRGRLKLLKCAKHRKWKKRCPDDCPDKPMNPFYGFPDVDDPLM